MRTAMPPSRRASGDQTLIKLIWLYFWLLIVEGALRKWILPGLSGPLLIIRDPVAVAIIAVAWRDGIKIQRLALMAMVGMGVLFAMLGLVQIGAGLIPPKVFLFGMRTYFLHFPLVFIMGSALRPDDVRAFVRWTLLISIPMTVLMVYQFVSPPEAWINKGVGEEGGQLLAARDHIRAAGTFSFISGTVAYLSLMFACCLGEFFTDRKAGWNLNHAVLASCVLLSMTSGSRGLVVSLGIVAITFVVCLIVRPDLLKQGARMLAVAAFSLLLLSGIGVFREGVATITERTLEASAVEGGSGGFIDRILSGITAPLGAGLSVPLYGGGIGLGTNVGAALVTGSADFLIAEDEWGRVFGEVGLIGGTLFIGFRVWIVILLARRGLRAAKHGYMLPLLLFGAGGVQMFNGQWGQATSLGFAVFVCGLAWAAGESADPVVRPSFRRIPQKVTRRYPVRS